MAPRPSQQRQTGWHYHQGACVKVDVCVAPLQPLDQAEADRQQQRTIKSLKQCALLGRGTQQPLWQKVTL